MNTFVNVHILNTNGTLLQPRYNPKLSLLLRIFPF